MSSKLTRRRLLEAALAATAGGAGSIATSCSGTVGDAGNRRRFPALEQNTVKLALAYTDLPVGCWEEATALAFLAQDVMSNPGAASEFSNDPDAYLSKLGLTGVSLPRDAVEVRLALALGDGEVRAAALSRDYKKFVQCLHEKGLLADGRSALVEAIVRSYSPNMPCENPETCYQTQGACTVTAICLAAIWVWAVVVQDVGVGVTVAALVNVYLAINVKTVVNPVEELTAEMVSRNPGLQLAAAVAGKEFSEGVAQALLDEMVESVSVAVESHDTYKRSPMTPTGLRGLVRAALTRQVAGRSLVPT